jgi:hypothetical protein
MQLVSGMDSTNVCCCADASLQSTGAVVRSTIHFYICQSFGTMCAACLVTAEGHRHRADWCVLVDHRLTRQDVRPSKRTEVLPYGGSGVIIFVGRAKRPAGASGGSSTPHKASSTCCNQPVLMSCNTLMSNVTSPQQAGKAINAALLKFPSIPPQPGCWLAVSDHRQPATKNCTAWMQ